MGWFVEHVASDRSRFAKIVLTPDAHPALARFTTVVRDQYRAALLAEGVYASDAEIDFIMGGTMELIMNWSKTWRMQQVPALRNNVIELARRILARGR